MSWVMAGIAGATATYQIGSSIYKNQKSKKMMEGNEYKIPEEAKQNLSDAQRQSLEGLPAEQQKQYLENIQQAQAVSIDAMQDRRGGLVGAAGVQASATQGYKDLLAMESQARVQNQQQLMQQRDVMAGYKDLEWKTNVFDPATELKKQASADQGAAIQNLAAAGTYAGQGLANQGGINQGGANQGGGVQRQSDVSQQDFWTKDTNVMQQQLGYGATTPQGTVYNSYGGVESSLNPVQYAEVQDNSGGVYGGGGQSFQL